MRTCLFVLAGLGFLMLAGCNRCGMWDWYKPCDLVEGRAARQCGTCDPCAYQAGQVVRREIAVPAPCEAPQAPATPAAPGTPATSAAPATSQPTTPPPATEPAPKNP